MIKTHPKHGVYPLFFSRKHNFNNENITQKLVTTIPKNGKKGLNLVMHTKFYIGLQKFSQARIRYLYSYTRSPNWIHIKNHHQIILKIHRSAHWYFTKMHGIYKIYVICMWGQLLMVGINKGYPNQLDSYFYES